MTSLPATTKKKKLFSFKVRQVAVSAVFVSLLCGGVSLAHSNLVLAQTGQLTGQNNTVAQDLSTTNTTESVEVVAIPPRVGENGEIKLKPGEKTQITLRVRNGTRNKIELTSMAKDMLVDDDGITPYTVEENISNRWSLASWMTITPSQHLLNPREIAQLNVLIEVPSDALPGGHYAMVLHQPQTIKPEKATEQASAGVTQRTGTLVYIVVDGPINEEAFIRDFKLPKFSEYGPVPYSYEVENRSDIHIRPKASLEIYNLFGKKIETIIVEPKNIFPFTNRSFEGTWDRIWGWGWYKAKLVMSFGTQGQIATSTSTFWLIPIRLILAFLVILLSIVAIGLAVRRHLQHRKEMEKKRIADLEEKVKELEQEKREDHIT
ncbi:MAG: hypothetical protein ACOZAN_04425 [Patescibacteria group bacterium]